MIQAHGWHLMEYGLSIFRGYRLIGHGLLYRKQHGSNDSFIPGSASEKTLGCGHRIGKMNPGCNSASDSMSRTLLGEMKHAESLRYNAYARVVYSQISYFDPQCNMQPLVPRNRS